MQTASYGRSGDIPLRHQRRVPITWAFLIHISVLERRCDNPLYLHGPPYHLALCRPSDTRTQCADGIHSGDYLIRVHVVNCKVGARASCASRTPAATAVLKAPRVLLSLKSKLLPLLDSVVFLLNLRKWCAHGPHTRARVEPYVSCSTGGAECRARCCTRRPCAASA